jgi:hypothetical protein
MSINEKDFSGFDDLETLDEKLNMLYRLLCHVETAVDKVQKQLDRRLGQ